MHNDEDSAAFDRELMFIETARSVPFPEILAHKPRS